MGRAQPSEVEQFIIANHRGVMRRWAMRYVRGPSDIDDLVQETCLRAHLKQDMFIPGTAVENWLWTMMRNIHFNGNVRSWRRDRMFREAVIKELPSTNVGLEGIKNNIGNDSNLREEIAAVKFEAPRAEDILYSKQILSILASIPADQREVLLLCRAEGMKFGEVAKLKGIPIGTVKSRLYRATEALMKRIGSGEIQYGSRTIINNVKQMEDASV